jgi:hypothetical protein
MSTAIEDTQVTTQAATEPSAEDPTFRKEVRVWVCPDPACGNYHGQSACHDQILTETTNLESDLSHTQETKAGNAKVVGNRGECPSCKSRGVIRQRIPMAFIVKVDPRLEPTAPDWAKRGALDFDRPR